MPVVVIFLRAVNLGGNKLRTKAFAEELGVRNLGAAGTFVGEGTPKAWQAKVRDALPFPTEVFVVPGDRVRKLVVADPLNVADMPAGERGYVTVLGAAPRGLALPVTTPDDGSWQLRVEQAVGPLLLTRRKVDHPGKFYPNEFIERRLGKPATTRGWETFVKLAAMLG